MGDLGSNITLTNEWNFILSNRMAMLYLECFVNSKLRRQRGSVVRVLDLHADVPGSNPTLTTVWICLG